MDKEIVELRLEPTVMFALKVDWRANVEPPPTGNGDAADKQARIKMLLPRAREAFDWIQTNRKGNIRVMVNDLPDYIKLEFYSKADAALFKLWWVG